MRKATLIINVIVVAFFISFLAYTFLARDHLESLARQFVTEKTILYSKPIVAVAEAALDSPLVLKVLSENQVKAIKNEIADYRNDSPSYIADLTRQKIRPTPVANGNPSLEKVASFKNKTRTFYDNTLASLITDLRVFSLSNAVAGLIAFGLAYRSSSEIRKGIVWFSFLMFVGVLCCSYLYVDDLTFFRLLFRTHMGWWYPVFLCAVIVALYRDFGRFAKAAEPGAAPNGGPAVSVKNSNAPVGPPSVSSPR